MMYRPIMPSRVVKVAWRNASVASALQFVKQPTEYRLEGGLPPAGSSASRGFDSQ